MIGDKSVLAQDVQYDTIGAIKSVKQDETVRSFSNSIFGVYPWYEGNNLRVLTVAGTGIYYDATQIKSLPNKGKFTFTEHNRAVYCASAENTICKVTVDNHVYNMGCPVPTTEVVSTPAGAGDMNGYYRIKTTFVSRHSSAEGGVYESEGGPSDYYENTTIATSNSLVITNIPLNTDPAYNVVARRLYISMGDNPAYADYYRAYVRNGLIWSSQIGDNSTTSATIHTTVDRDGVDELTVLTQDNPVPPVGIYLANHFDHFVLTGNPTYNNRWYFAKVSNENIPSVNFITEKEEIMGQVEWNNSVYTPTKSKLYIKSGATEDNFFNQDTEVSDGCVAPHTLTGSPYGLLYMSYNGVVVYTGSKDVAVLSKEIDPVFLSLPATYFKNACGIYFDNEYWISVTETGYTVNNVTWVYNFRTNGWRKVNQGYTCFNKDERGFKLYGASYGNLYRINDASTYEVWKYQSKEYDSALIPYSKAGVRFYPKMAYIEIDTKGQNVDITPYYDGVAQTVLTANTDTRRRLERRMPAGSCLRLSFVIEQNVSNYQTIVYNYNVECETTV